MKNILTLIYCLLTGNLLFAQHARIVTSGRIEFEKTVNMFAITQHELGTNPDAYSLQAFEQYKKSQPQFVKLESTLDFDKNKSLFSPVAPIQAIANFDDNPVAKQFNSVYTDFAANSSIVQKEVYGDVFLVKDTARKIKWKITDETRDIAGYTCRRANGLVLDSIYVVAFYTDKIWVSSGPESFNGLPGMILSVILPHENVRWDALKVTDQAIAPTVIVPPKKGKTINNKQLKDMLKEAMKNWGQAGPFEMRIYSL